jgi:hypothetical protein
LKRGSAKFFSGVAMTILPSLLRAATLLASFQQ